MRSESESDCLSLTDLDCQINKVIKS